MSDGPLMQPPGWYYAKGDPAGTQRYWDGNSWQGGPQPVPGGATPEHGVTAEPLQRILARAIDGVIWVVISVLVAIPVGVVAGVTGAGGWLRAAGEVFAGLLIVVYEVWMVAARGATIGKLAVGLRVVSAVEPEARSDTEPEARSDTEPEARSDTEPEARIDTKTAARRMALLAAHSFLRPIGFLGALVFAALAIAGLVMLFVDPKRQTPWDKVGKTIVQDV